MGTPTPTPTPTPTCADQPPSVIASLADGSMPNCAAVSAAGLCTNPLDAGVAALVEANCPETCGFCGSTPPPPPTPSSDPNVTPVVTASAAFLDGYETYQLAVTLTGDAANVYTIYGTADSPMSVPPAFQEAPPFGANTGGTNPAFWAVMANAEFDSWLTVGITQGDSAGSLSSIGLNFDAWTESNGLATSDGAVFWMNPDDGPAAGTDAVLAQITVPEGSSGTASMGMQGRSSSGTDWQSDNIEFSYPATAPTPSPTTPSPTPTPTPTVDPNVTPVVTAAETS